MGKYVIMRADDLGFSEGVNFGIAKTVDQGPIRTVGLMVNMEAAAHGVSLLRGKGCCMGLHGNVSVGRPVCRAEEIPTLVDQNGEFYPSARYRSGEDFASAGDLYRELTAQYRRYVELVGEKPSYIEAHAVMNRKLDQVLREIAGEHGLIYQPPFADMEVNGKTVRMCEMRSMDQGYDARTAVREVLSGTEEGQYYVYVCHPGYLDRYLWRRSSLRVPRMDEVDMLTDPELAEWMEAEGICCVTYDDL